MHILESVDRTDDGDVEDGEAGGDQVVEVPMLLDGEVGGH